MGGTDAQAYLRLAFFTNIQAQLQLDSECVGIDDRDRHSRRFGQPGAMWMRTNAPSLQLLTQPELLSFGFRGSKLALSIVCPRSPDRKFFDLLRLPTFSGWTFWLLLRFNLRGSLIEHIYTLRSGSSRHPLLRRDVMENLALLPSLQRQYGRRVRKTRRRRRAPRTRPAYICICSRSRYQYCHSHSACFWAVRGSNCGSDRAV